MSEMSPERAELLARLELEIEDAWNSGAKGGQDGTIVNRLARMHPELAEELYVFFAAVVATNLHPDRERPELVGADERTREWLSREGYQRIASAYRDSVPATTPTSGGGHSVLVTLKQHTGKTADAIAQKLDLARGFFIGITDHPNVVPPPIRREVARRAHAAFGLDEAITLEAFDAPISMKRAASRSKPYKASPVSFEDIVERSKMDEKQKEFWRRLAEKVEDA